VILYDFDINLNVHYNIKRKIRVVNLIVSFVFWRKIYELRLSILVVALNKNSTFKHLLEKKSTSNNKKISTYYKLKAMYILRWEYSIAISGSFAEV